MLKFNLCYFFKLKHIFILFLPLFVFWQGIISERWNGLSTRICSSLCRVVQNSASTCDLSPCLLPCYYAVRVHHSSSDEYSKRSEIKLQCRPLEHCLLSENNSCYTTDPHIKFEHKTLPCRCHLSTADQPNQMKHQIFCGFILHECLGSESKLKRKNLQKKYIAMITVDSWHSELVPFLYSILT